MDEFWRFSKLGKVNLWYIREKGYLGRFLKYGTRFGKFWVEVEKLVMESLKKK